MPSAIEICNAGLELVGADPINSFADGLREANVSAILYPTTKKALLEARQWTFAKGQAQLSKLVATPLYGFANAFQLPADFLRLDETEVLDGPYRKYEDKLYSNMDSMFISYVFDAPEGEFSSGFVKVVEASMAVQYAFALLSSRTLAASMQALVKTYMDDAVAADKQNESNKTIRSGSFSLTAERGRNANQAQFVRIR